MVTAALRSVRTVVRGREDTRVRAVWRMLLPLVAFVLVVVGVLIALTRIPAVHEHSTRVLAFRTGGFLLATGVVLVLSARLLDRRPVTDYGFDLDRRWWLDLAGGLALGLLASGLMAAGHLALGWATVHEVLSPGAGSFALGMVVTLLFFASVGLVEEVLFRGVFVLNAVEGLGKRVSSPRTAVLLAWVATSLVFGVLHVREALAGEGGPVAAYLVSVTLAGLAYGLAYVLTDSLALPIGLHAAANFGMSAVFGSTTDHADAYPALVRLQVEFSGVWQAVHGLELLFSTALLLFAVAWVYATRGEVAVADSLLEAADRGKKPRSAGGRTDASDR